jgi:Raf kinase inhibitor-like YbhB/YbcL family protein
MKRSAIVLSFTFAFAVAGMEIGCSSGSGGGGTGGFSSGTGGSPTGTGGSPTGTGGSPTGSGGATGGTPGTGGTSTGGNIGTGGATGGSGTTGTGGAAGRGGAGGATGGAGGGASASLSLTSTAFIEGMMIPAAQTCTGNSNISPPLTWTAGPSATMGYGLALYDMTNGYTHWTIWNLPASTTSLPGALPSNGTLTTPVMAQQNNTFGGTGYYGPCPSGATHTYVFEVYAVDVATLPSVSATTAPKDVRTQMMAHALAKGALSGTSNASK